MVTPMRVLVAVGQALDVSWLVPAALGIAPTRSSFVVVHVADDRDQGFGIGQELVAEAVDLFRAHGADAVPRLVGRPDPTPAIIGLAREEAADFVVLGPGGRRVLGLGSTVRQVIARTPLPVLYVPRSPLPPRLRVSRVLVAVASEDDIPRLVAGVRLCGVRQAVVTHLPRAVAVHAAPHAFVEAPETSTSVTDATLAAMRGLGWSASLAPARERHDLGKAIEAAATAADAQVIVVASSRHRFLTGSGAYEIAEHATRPILFAAI